MRGVVPSLPFWKMEGCGNDFVVVYHHQLPDRAGPDWAIHLCDRRLGVGADGVLVVRRREDLDAPSRAVGAVGGMEVWNADGSRAEMCGNGVRCVVVRLIQDGHVHDGARDVPILTGAGVVWAHRDDGEVVVDMGPPRSVPAGPEALDLDGTSVRYFRVSMGNPHAVLFGDEVADGAAGWLRVAPRLETHRAFPQRTNVELATVLDEHTIRLRVWERGVGETMACGSGACATVVAAVRAGRISAEAARRGVEVLLPGGRLRVDWAGRVEDSVLLRGPARTVYEGTWRRTS